jgi:hypothetical protein
VRAVWVGVAARGQSWRPQFRLLPKAAATMTSFNAAALATAGTADPAPTPSAAGEAQPASSSAPAPAPAPTDATAAAAGDSPLGATTALAPGPGGGAGALASRMGTGPLLSVTQLCQMAGFVGSSSDRIVLKEALVVGNLSCRPGATVHEVGEWGQC